MRKQEVDSFLQYLAEQSSREPPTLLIRDSTRIHAAIRDDKRDVWLLDHGFYLCFLPVYRTELNFIEQL